jgi:hypothetical protein
LKLDLQFYLGMELELGNSVFEELDTDLDLDSQFHYVWNWNWNNLV